MTNSDELLKRLDEKVVVWSDVSLYGQAAARIRELELLLEAADAEIDVERHLGESRNVTRQIHSDAKAAVRIRELEAQLAAADEHAKRIEALVEKVVSWDGEPATHVIVPVEPTEAMLEAISDEIAGSGWMPSDENLRAIYRAAQADALKVAG